MRREGGREGGRKGGKERAAGARGGGLAGGWVCSSQSGAVQTVLDEVVGTSLPPPFVYTHTHTQTDRQIDRCSLHAGEKERYDSCSGGYAGWDGFGTVMCCLRIGCYGFGYVGMWDWEVGCEFLGGWVVLMGGLSVVELSPVSCGACSTRSIAQSVIVISDLLRGAAAFELSGRGSPDRESGLRCTSATQA